MRNLLITIIALSLSSCFNKEDKEVIASYNEKDLFLSEITSKIPKHLEDSAYFVEKYIDDWIRKELMISYAEINLNKDLIYYEEQINDYRASLLIYAYQQELLNQNFDTVINILDIKSYYSQYKDELRLSKNIYKGRFIIIDKNAPNLSRLDKLYMSEKDEDIIQLEDYCIQFSKEYNIDNIKWSYFSIVNNKLPKQIINEESLLKKTKSAIFEDENFKYYLYISDYKLIGTISPIEIEFERIKDVLLNKKKIEYLKKIENELYQNALDRNKIKIYNE